MIQLANYAEIANLANHKSKLTYKGLKIECIVRGMDFQKVVSGDATTLTGFLLKNSTNPVQIHLLDKYDDFIDLELTKSRKDYLIHPSLRLGYLSNNSDDREKPLIEKPKREKSEIKEVKSKSKDKRGIVKHTKKSLTAKLQSKGYKIEKVIRRVLRRYPDANIKSIKIWYRKFERSQKS